MLQPPVISATGTLSLDERGRLLIGDQPLPELVARIVNVRKGEATPDRYVVTIARLTD